MLSCVPSVSGVLCSHGLCKTSPQEATATALKGVAKGKVKDSLDWHTHRSSSVLVNNTESVVSESPVLFVNLLLSTPAIAWILSAE